MTADRQGPRSLTDQVRAGLVARIRAGEFKVGEKIPSFRSLMSQYDVSEGTVLSAVRDLQHAGVLESSTGRGTFVKRIPEHEDETPEAVLDDLRAEIAELRQRVEVLEQRLRGN